MKHKKYKCKNCPDFILPRTAKKGSGLCRSCSQIKKNKNNPDYKKNLYKCSCGNKKSYGAKICKECYREFRNGEGNPNWKNGISFKPYSRSFNEQIKEYIRGRDGYKCRNCNMSENKHLNKYNKKLSVHHIDYNKMNCNVYNLITLCFSCNSKANKNRDHHKKIYEKLVKQKPLRVAFDLDNVLCDPISHVYNTNEILKVKPRYNMIKILKELKEKKCSIIIYTARKSFICKNETKKWLKKHKIPYDRIFFDKVPFDILIDDRAMSSYTSFLSAKKILNQLNRVNKRIKNSRKRLKND